MKLNIQSQIELHREATASLMMVERCRAYIKELPEGDISQDFWVKTEKQYMDDYIKAMMKLMETPLMKVWEELPE